MTDTAFKPDDTNALTTGMPCVFSVLKYEKEGEGLDVITAEDAENSDCRFAFQFAERLSDGSIAEIAEQGDTREVYDIPGFLVAALDFACHANSSGRCTADEGKTELRVFEITADDLINNTVSGKRVRFEIAARGTKPGNTARFDGIIEGTIP
jgi:hypothetical protein